MAEIFPKHTSLYAVKMKGKGDDNGQGAEWRITLHVISLLTYATDGISCFYLIMLQAHSLFYKPDLMINFLSTNIEKTLPVRPPS